MDTLLQFWKYKLFAVGENDVVIGQLILIGLFLIILFLSYRIVMRRYFPKVFSLEAFSEKRSKELRNILKALGLFAFILMLCLILDLNYVLYEGEDYQVSILTILNALLFFQFLRLFNWIITSFLISGAQVSINKNVDPKQDNYSSEENTRLFQNRVNSITRTVRWIFYSIFALYLFSNLHIDYTLFERNINGEQVNFGISRIINAILIILIAKFLIWLITEIVLLNIYNNRDIDEGSIYAINQLIKYIIYVFAIVIALDVFGINMNILLGGAAALLVGIGLGLQQTFNDLVSGIIILFERSVSVGDVMEIEGEVGTIKKIGLRASKIETYGSKTIVVPNHLLVTEKVTNWNNHSNRVRFKIDVGVAYGSDAKVVKKLLLESVKDNPYISYPYPFVRLESFGESSLDFGLYFFTKNLQIIEDIKSDIRIEINRLFKENEIEIPFPQRVVHNA